MKNYVLIFFLFMTFFLINCSSENQTDPNLRVMTFNIRLNVASDSLNAWPYRKDNVAAMFHFHHADLVGIQEGLPEQVSDLAEGLPE